MLMRLELLKKVIIILLAIFVAAITTSFGLGIRKAHGEPGEHHEAPATVDEQELETLDEQPLEGLDGSEGSDSSAAAPSEHEQAEGTETEISVEPATGAEGEEGKTESIAEENVEEVSDEMSAEDMKKRIEELEASLDESREFGEKLLLKFAEFQKEIFTALIGLKTLSKDESDVPSDMMNDFEEQLMKIEADYEPIRVKMVELNNALHALSIRDEAIQQSLSSTEDAGEIARLEAEVKQNQTRRQSLRKEQEGVEVADELMKSRYGLLSLIHKRLLDRKRKQNPTVIINVETPDEFTDPAPKPEVVENEVKEVDGKIVIVTSDPVGTIATLLSEGLQAFGVIQALNDQGRTFEPPQGELSIPQEPRESTTASNREGNRSGRVEKNDTPSLLRAK